MKTFVPSQPLLFPFTGVGEEFLLRILHSAQTLQLRLSQFLRPFQLTPAQYQVLRILQVADPSGLSCSEIGLRMLTADSDLTRLLDRLTERSLLSRSRALDRRRFTVRLSPQGHQLLADLQPRLIEFYQQQLGGMDHKRLQAGNILLQEWAGEIPHATKKKKEPKTPSLF